MWFDCEWIDHGSIKCNYKRIASLRYVHVQREASHQITNIKDEVKLPRRMERCKDFTHSEALPDDDDVYDDVSSYSQHTIILKTKQVIII